MLALKRITAPDPKKAAPVFAHDDN